MNIILIIIDALRADCLGSYGFPTEITPNIDKIAKKGTIFENAYACINATDPSLTTIFTGKYPISHGILEHGPKVKKESVMLFYRKNKVTLTKFLKKEGYKTFAIDWLGRWHKMYFDYYSGILMKDKPGKTREYKLKEEKIKSKIKAYLKKHPTFFRMFENFKYNFIYKLIRRKKAKSSSRALVFGDARIITNKAKEIIEHNKNEKFFLFIHYWDTHASYYCPTKNFEKFYKIAAHNYKKYADKKIEDILDSIKKAEIRDLIKSMGNEVVEVIARYYGAINFVDEQIGKLVYLLEDIGILENTSFIITSDHGESLVEHGIYFDHHGLYDVTIHVPLIISGGVFPKNTKINALVQHTDILPTILDMFNEYDKYYFEVDGYSLLPLLWNEVEKLRDYIFAEETFTQSKMAIRTRKYKYIKAKSKSSAYCTYCGRVHGGFEELYDLEVDPNENHNIINQNKDAARELNKKLVELLIKIQNKRKLEKVKQTIKKMRLTSQ